MKDWIKELKEECDDARTNRPNAVGRVAVISRLIAEIESLDKENQRYEMLVADLQLQLSDKTK